MIYDRSNRVFKTGVESSATQQATRVAFDRVVAENGARSRVMTSAGALVHGLKRLGAKKVSLMAPYMKPLPASWQRTLAFLLTDQVGFFGVQPEPEFDKQGPIGAIGHDDLGLVQIAQRGFPGIVHLAAGYSPILMRGPSSM